MNKDILLRLAISSVFLYHGFAKKTRSFATSFNLPYSIALFVKIAEIVAGFGFLIGGFNIQKVSCIITIISSLLVIPILLYAISKVHFKNGFSVMKNGWESQFVLLMTAIFLPINTCL